MPHPRQHFETNNRERGAALLTTTLAIVLILTAIGLSMVSSGLFEGFLSGAQANSRDAYAGAQSGIRDALLRIARNKTFTNAGYLIPAGCTLNNAALCTRVIVESAQSSCSQALAANQKCVIATGTFASVTRTIEVILYVAPANGKITQVSWKEI